MILQIAPDAPWWVHAAANTALVLHIGAGSVGMILGAVALLAPKGGRTHRAAGKLFLVSMLLMTGIAAIVAPMLPQRISTIAAFLTGYLVLTAWTTVSRRPGRVGPTDTVSLLFALAIVAACIALYLIAKAQGLEELDGQGVGGLIVFGALASIAAFGDARLIAGRGVFGPARIARHLWRMCVALLLALGSFFLGQQQLFPRALQGSLVLALPILAALALMLFWLFRVRLAKAWRAA